MQIEHYQTSRPSRSIAAQVRHSSAVFGLGSMAAALLLVPNASAADGDIPKGVLETGLTYVLRDTAAFHNPDNPPNLNNWEPYVGVLGTSTFLVGANTFAEGIANEQRFAFMLQPAAGGPAAAGDHFFADDGSPYRGQINISRRDGNPQRIAGDPRPGATNIITGAEASPHLFDAFKSDTRWELGFDRGADRRYGTVQTFSIDPVSLTQTALSKAVDAIHGRRTEGSSPVNQVTRFGGDLVGLDNGNFVVMVEDRSKLLHADGNASVFAIIAPDGTIVTESTLVAPGDQWANLAAFRGGFAVRTRGILYFFNNSGELLGQVSGSATSGVSFDAGRGDGTRMGGHINSPYVYLAGAADVLDNEGNKVPGIYVAAFDSRDQSFVARFKVDNFPNARDRTVVAADALNRVTVAFASKPEGYSGNQIVARVLQFDDCAKEFSALTEPFLAFHNNGTTGFLTTTPSIAVTTKQILVAAKGNINLDNNVDAGPNSPAQTTVYAVINHPDPQEDPTTPATPTIPASAEANGLTRIVPDKVIFDDPNNPPNLNNWEPYVGILGNSVFLVGANTFAEGVANEQRFGFVMQPVAGGANAVGDHFFADDGAPYRGQINVSRRDGNPQRVAGDPRPGALHVITGAEASPHLYDPFKGNDRWELGFDRGLNRRYGTVQTFEINPSTLQQTMLSKAQDVANGRLTEGSSASDQASRFGGDVLGLDNGNFVVTVEDRTRVRNPGGNAAVFTILSPTGAIVKETTLVANGDLWSNLAAFKGGFAVRVAGIIYFYSNDGELKGQINSRDSGIGFDPGRGDNTRIAGHINSPYVYLAGNAPVITPAGNVDPGVRVAVFDSRNQSFVATARVDARNGSNDRVVIAVDPLDRFVVAYGNRPEGFARNQVTARVMRFDSCSGVIEALTPNFFAFINHNTTDTLTSNPSVAITTKQILIAAKGIINLANDPAQPADSRAQTTLYTVIGHPDPKDDPTPGIAGPSVITLARPSAPANGKIQLSWQGGNGPFTIQRKASITGAWADVQTGVAGNSAAVDVTGSQGYFRILGQ